VILIAYYYSILNHNLLREVFFCQNLTFIRLTLKAVCIMCIMIMTDNVLGIEITL
jgi:hypothetical protein